jgi:phosphopantothenoylcysteine decarboxylase/phosphopantothenate--cysteine ligase
MIKGKKIIIGITGSIAAYKSCFLVRLLKKENADVQVIMTDAAQDFITPLTLSA